MIIIVIIWCEKANTLIQTPRSEVHCAVLPRSLCPQLSTLHPTHNSLPLRPCFGIIVDDIYVLIFLQAQMQMQWHSGSTVSQRH